MTKEQIISAWKNLASNKQNSAQQHVFYILARAIASEETPETAKYTLIHLKRAFSPVKSSIKLNNGRYPYDTLTNILYQFQSSGISWTSKKTIVQQVAQEFGIELTDEESTRIRTLCINIIELMKAE